MQSNSLPTGKACRNMAKMGNTALQIPLNQDLEENQSLDHSVVTCAVTLILGQSSHSVE